MDIHMLFPMFFAYSVTEVQFPESAKDHGDCDFGQVNFYHSVAFSLAMRYWRGLHHQL